MMEYSLQMHNHSHHRKIPPPKPSKSEIKEVPPPPPPQPLISVHQALGGGEVADVLLWRKRYGSLSFLIAGTFLWLLFSQGAYSPIAFITNLVFLLVVILFFWAKSASLFNRPPPPIPDLAVPENTVEQSANVIRVWINRTLAIVHQIIVCGNLRLLTQVAAVLWAISLIGSLFNFVTFAYFGGGFPAVTFNSIALEFKLIFLVMCWVIRLCGLCPAGYLLAFMIPVFYEKNQADVDECLPLLWVLILEAYKNLEKSVLNKIPVSLHNKKRP